MPPAGEQPTSFAAKDVCWYAVYACVRHERVVARQLTERNVNCFVPTYRTVHRWKDRNKVLDLALFPGYLFVRIALRDRLKVLQIPSVVSLISFNGVPVPIDDDEIEVLRRGFEGRVRMEPHPYLKAGRRVRIKAGALAGAEGILVRRKDCYRVVMSIDLLMRSVAVEVNEADVEAAG